jgi:hypothetical protein
MTFTIQLPPEIETSLVAQAEALGLPVPQYVEYLLRQQIPVRGNVLSPAERAAAWRESAKDIPPTPPLSDEAISRENIYGNHG